MNSREQARIFLEFWHAYGLEEFRDLQAAYVFSGFSTDIGIVMNEVRQRTHDYAKALANL